MSEPDPWRALAAAVIVRAVKDSRCKNGHKAAQGLGLPPGQTLAQEAAAFLRSEATADLLLLLDLDPAWLDRLGLPELPGQQLALPLYMPRQAPRCCPGARPGPPMREPSRRPARVRAAPAAHPSERERLEVDREQEAYQVTVKALQRAAELDHDFTIACMHLGFSALADRRGLLVKGPQAPAVAQRLAIERPDLLIDIDPRPIVNPAGWAALGM